MYAAMYKKIVCDKTCNKQGKKVNIYDHPLFVPLPLTVAPPAAPLPFYQVPKTC